MTAHDVRALRVCRGCSQIGDGRNMVQIERGRAARHYHGRCYIATYGVDRLLELPREQLDRLTLDDVGVDVMRRLLKFDALPSVGRCALCGARNCKSPHD